MKCRGSVQMVEPVEHNGPASTAKQHPLRALFQSFKRFNQWYVRYPTTPRRLGVTMVVSAVLMAITLAVVLTVMNSHSRFKSDWVVWGIFYPLVFTLVRAPRQYRTARQLAGLSPDRISLVSRIIERTLASLVVGALSAMVLWFGAVHGGTALTLFPIFSTLAFLMSMLIMKPSEGTNRPRIFRWRYMPMRSYLSCNENERWLVKSALLAIFALKRSTTPLEYWSRWTAKTRSAVIEWVWLLMALGSGFVAMMAILAPHCMTRTNQIGFPLAAMAVLVTMLMIKGLVVLQSPWRNVS